MTKLDIENIKNIIEKNKDESAKIKEEENLKQYNSFKIEQKCECLIKTSKADTLIDIINYCKEKDINVHIIGNGTNILFTNYISGIILIYTKDEIKKINEDEKYIYYNIDAGCKMAQIGYFLANEEVSGFEALAGIPGSFGGAIFMNAGCYGVETKDILDSVTYYDEKAKKQKTQKVKELDFSYRTSYIKENNKQNKEKKIILSGVIKFEKVNKNFENKVTKENIIFTMGEYMQKRKNSQPLEFPNAGSFFKRVDNVIVSKLIDEAGLKGYHVGDAYVSEKHAGFIVNKGNATSKDILELAQKVKDIIYEKYNVKIEMEVEKIS